MGNQAARFLGNYNSKLKNQGGIRNRKQDYFLSLFKTNIIQFVQNI